jgi:hypothetical protein
MEVETETIEVLTAEEEGIEPEVVVVVEQPESDSQNMEQIFDEAKVEVQEAVAALGLEAFFPGQADREQSIVVTIEGAPPGTYSFEVCPADPQASPSKSVGSELQSDSSSSEEESVEPPELPNGPSTPGPSNTVPDTPDCDCPPAPKRKQPSAVRRKRQRMLEKLLAVIAGDDSSTSDDFHPSCRLSSFFPFKDRIPITLRSHVVYQFMCQCCSTLYVGQTR